MIMKKKNRGKRKMKMSKWRRMTMKNRKQTKKAF